MLISTHVVAGALLGRALARPVPALVLGVASHLALDRLPHWGQGHGWPPPDLDDQTFRVAVVDGLVGLALIAVIARVVPARHRVPVLAGIVGACAPDLDKPGRRFLGRSPWPQRFDYVHATIQTDVESPDRLAEDVAVAAVGAAVAVAVLGDDDR